MGLLRANTPTWKNLFYRGIDDKPKSTRSGRGGSSVREGNDAERKAQKVFDGGGGHFVDGLHSTRGQRPLSEYNM